MEKHRIFLADKCYIGENAPTALNVLLGANSAKGYDTELRRMDAVRESLLPVTLITDLSLYKTRPGEELWRRISRDGDFVVGTVPVYQAVQANHRISASLLLEQIQEQAENGVGLMTIHPTPSYQLIELSQQRCIPITSRGGAAVCRDMIVGQKEENIYIQILDEVIAIARANHVTLSIGSSFRSGALRDGMDSAYQAELLKQIEIAEYCFNNGVGAIIETPGHASPQHIFQICEWLKKRNGFPIMPLGPMPTDCALDQDDMAACMGAVLMGTNDCADILSIVTREEHSGGVPTIESTLSAIRKYAVAKHIIDIYKLNDTKMDDEISFLRSQKSSCLIEGEEDCIRCGKLCPLRTDVSHKGF